MQSDVIAAAIRRSKRLAKQRSLDRKIQSQRGYNLKHPRRVKQPIRWVAMTGDAMPGTSQQARNLLGKSGSLSTPGENRMRLRANPRNPQWIARLKEARNAQS